MRQQIGTSYEREDDYRFWLLRLYNAVRNPELCKIMPEEGLQEALGRLGFTKGVKE